MNSATSETHVLDEPVMKPLLERLVHGINASATYTDEDSISRIGEDIVVGWAPAFVLRRRSRRDWIEVFERIAKQIDTTGEVPDGIAGLVDPAHRPDTGLDWSEETGALIDVEGDPFLPLPVNEKQERVIREVNKRAQVLVQGPPGTGKTHTAAALISHLLAMGKRVLVTAQTDRALYEVRDKLPSSVRDLAVSVVGSSRDDMAELGSAVQRVSTAAAEYDQADMVRRESSVLSEIERLRQERASRYRDLVDAREVEVRQHSQPPYSGTLAEITRQHDADRAGHDWLVELAVGSTADRPPLADEEAVELLSLLRDPSLEDDRPEAESRRPERDSLHGPDEFFALIDAEWKASVGVDQHEIDRNSQVYERLIALGEEDRSGLKRGLHAVDRTMHDLSLRPEQWLVGALAEIRGGKAAPWIDRADMVQGLLDELTPAIAAIGPTTSVVVQGDPERLAPLVKSVKEHLGPSGSIKTNPDGTPKLGAFSSKVLKQCRELFEVVRINGCRPRRQRPCRSWRTGWRPTVRSRRLIGPGRSAR